MSESRRSKVLGEVADIKQGRYLAKEDMAAERSAKFPVPVHGANGIIGWTDHAMYPAGVPLVTCRGSNSGMVLWADGPLWVSNNAMAIIPFDGDLRFAYYCLLNSPPYETVSGSAQPQITRTALAPKRVLWPAEDIQRAISGALTALDDKIELNRRMNETLEAMAQAIFRDWFVDFGPVRRKLEGTTDPVAIMGGLTPDPARAAELAGLFPDGFGTDDAPEGWRLMSLSDVADQYKGTVNPQTLPGELFEHYSLPAHDTGQAPARDLGIDIKSNKVPVPSGAILVSKLNPETLRVWAPTEYAGLPQVASTEFLVFTPKKSAGRGLLYFLFRDPIVRQIMEGMVTGTSKSHQRISPPALLQTKLVVGEGLAFAAFEALAEPMLRRSLALRAENRTLAETRDYLLPRLMSGEVRVGELGAQTRSEIAA